MIGIENIIPQRAPMVMIDALEQWDDEGASSVFTIREEGMFVDEGKLQASGLVENIAQTAAARSGYLAYQAGRDPDIGYIGGISRLEVRFLPSTGTQIKTRIRILHQVLNATIVEGTVTSDGQVAATCELKIFLNP